MTSGRTHELLEQLGTSIQADLKREYLGKPQQSALQSIAFRIEDYNSWVLMGCWPDEVEKLAQSLEAAHQLDINPVMLRRELSLRLGDIYSRLRSSWPEIQACEE